MEEWWDETAAEMTFDWQTSAVPTTASVPQTLAVPTTAPQTLAVKPGADAVSGPGAAPTALAADSLGPGQQQGPGELFNLSRVLDRQPGCSFLAFELVALGGDCCQLALEVFHLLR